MEEDKKVFSHFKDQLSEQARLSKKKADKGFAEEDNIEVVDATGDSSGFEDVDSDEEQVITAKKTKS